MMNIRKFFKVRNYYLLLGVIMINVGCTKNFLEYNTNPNEATDEMTDWDNVRTGSLLLQMEQNVLVVAQPGLNIGSDRYHGWRWLCRLFWFSCSQYQFCRSLQLG